MQQWSGRRSQLRAMALLLALVVAAAPLGGCRKRRSGQGLTAAGAATAKALAGYYDSLIEDTVATWQMEAVFRATQEPPIPFPAQEMDLLQARAEALERRAEMARDLASLYGSFERLASYDAADETRRAAGELGESLRKVPPLPNSGFAPVLGFVAGEIASWRQYRDLQQANAVTLRVLRGVHEMFTRELPAYQQIAQDRHDQAEARGVEYLQQRVVDGRPLLEDVRKEIDLPWGAGQPDLKEGATVEAAVALYRVRVAQRKLRSERAAEGLETSLRALIAGHEAFAQGGGVSLEDLYEALQRAETCLEEMAKAGGQG